MSLVHEPEELVKPTAMRMKLRMSTQMPFADQSSRVSRVMQMLSQRDLAARQTCIRIFVVMADRIEFVSEASLVTPGHDPRTRRAAVRSRDVPAGEPDAVLRDGIDMRRGDFRTPLTPEFSVTQVIGKQQHDVWLP